MPAKTKTKTKKLKTKKQKTKKQKTKKQKTKKTKNKKNKNKNFTCMPAGSQSPVGVEGTERTPPDDLRTT